MSDSTQGAGLGAAARCRACGRRVVAEPGCPEHGSVPGSRTDEDGPADVELPRFPGYRALRQVGEGGFGTVYAAVPEAGGAEIAIKLARADRPDAGPRLVREGAILAEIGP
ncbi:MAG TPA: hypothetical protein VLS89_06175, partial [Candidatus Nanopelagicales bacterium]|nr:hypothetical protein [Candidatus Nanopelagicales bacterium]